ncbi:hypothetical protein [Bradyrhizobium sp. 192]|uniref:hypothetical protein n=1 Tax=Bradyrhizobium sp. 192 TaxID=2782660 RepID=UPI001FFEC246|nr:hypothetical protein [Bradyrhizobium sp. 192]UPJ57348.1 hypothetical protein IVB24_33080 [Bradyrhizobium sp. 192]
MLMKRVGARIQAGIHARGNGFPHGKICRVHAFSGAGKSGWFMEERNSVMAGLGHDDVS